MMWIWHVWVVAVGPWAFVFAMQTVQPPVEGATPVSRQPPTSTLDHAQPPADAVDPDEAIRLAVDIFDRLATVDDDAQSKALLEEANRYIEIVQTQDPASPWLSYLYGRSLARAGRPWDAVQQLRTFVETAAGRNEWRAYATLGDLFVDEYPRLAKSNYEKAAALNADDPGVLFGLSVCTYKLGELDEAVRLGREAVVADGRRTIRYLSHLASVLRASHKWEEAMRETRAALQSARNAQSARPGVREPLEVVEAQYRLLISILNDWVKQPDQDSADRRLRLARYVRQRGLIQQKLLLFDVLDILEAGVGKNASDTPIPLLEQYAITLSEVGRTDDAISVLKRIRTRDPENKVAIEWLARLHPDSIATKQSPEP